MKNSRTSILTGISVALFIVVSSAAGILGFPDGATDGDKLFSSCSGCHGAAGTGTVSLVASEPSVGPGGTVGITVTVAEPAGGQSSLAGVFLLKGPAGTQESVTADGWTIVRDPNGGTHNYVEKGVSPGSPAIFAWTLSAPQAAGTYSVYATAVHGGAGAVYETSAEASITVAEPPAKADPHPVIEEPALPATLVAGTAHDIRVRIIDAPDGVQAANIHYTHPGSRDTGETELQLEEGTPQDGVWGGTLSAGHNPGSLELYLTATDGNGSARSPADGTFVISVVAPGVPEISAISLPATVETGSTLGVSVPIRDSDGGVRLAVLRYRLPGAADFSTVQMALAEGTPNSGRWTAEILSGAEPGALELCVAATDGTNDACSPAAGYLTVQVVRPLGPSLAVEAPGAAAYGSAPEIRARAADPAGVTGVQVHFKLANEQSRRVAEMALWSGDARDGEWAAALPAADATGECSFYVVARNPKGESRSADMSFEVLPDLYVLAPEFSAKDITVKEEAVISAVVGNRGDRPVTGVTVQFLDMSYSVGDARLIRSVAGVTVPANGQVTVTARWTPQVEGSREIAVVVIPDGLAADGNSENDRAEATARVSLESGMGVRFPVPSLGDMWAQLAVIAGAGTVVGAGLLYGLVSQERKGGRRKGRRDTGGSSAKRV